MSDHPTAGRGIDRGAVKVEADGGAARADAILDVRRTGAMIGHLGVDDIGHVDAARRLLAGDQAGAGLADVHRILDMARPAFTVPPEDVAGREVVSGRDLHAHCSACFANATSRFSASLSSTTSPATMIAGLSTFSLATMPPRSARRVRIARCPGSVAFSITATGRPGSTPSAISLSAMAAALATPM